jgi:hypothetical protein
MAIGSGTMRCCRPGSASSTKRCALGHAGWVATGNYVARNLGRVYLGRLGYATGHPSPVLEGWIPSRRASRSCAYNAGAVDAARKGWKMLRKQKVRGYDGASPPPPSVIRKGPAMVFKIEHIGATSSSPRLRSSAGASNTTNNILPFCNTVVPRTPS